MTNGFIPMFHSEQEERSTSVLKNPNAAEVSQQWIDTFGND